MAERQKDAVDRQLERWLGTDRLADDGFSRRVMARIRRRVWVRRLALPSGMAVGAAIGARPLFELFNLLPGLMGALSGSMPGLPRQIDITLPGLPTVLLGAALIVALFITSSLLEE